MGAEEDVWAGLVLPGGGDGEGGETDGAAEAVSCAPTVGSFSFSCLQGWVVQKAYRFPSVLTVELGTSNRQFGQK